MDVRVGFPAPLRALKTNLDNDYDCLANAWIRMEYASGGERTIYFGMNCSWTITLRVTEHTGSC